jgi:hypothetical protein
MASTSQIPGGARGRGADSRMHESIPFTSTCPKCQVQQTQRGFSRAALGRLLHSGHPIEAYCVTCDEFWAISPRERAALVAGLGGDA